MFLIISIYINRAYFIVYQPFQASNPLVEKDKTNDVTKKRKKEETINSILLGNFRSGFNRWLILSFNRI